MKSFFKQSTVMLCPMLLLLLCTEIAKGQGNLQAIEKLKTQISLCDQFIEYWKSEEADLFARKEPVLATVAAKHKLRWMDQKSSYQASLRNLTDPSPSGVSQSRKRPPAKTTPATGIDLKKVRTLEAQLRGLTKRFDSVTWQVKPSNEPFHNLALLTEQRAISDSIDKVKAQLKLFDWKNVKAVNAALLKAELDQLKADEKTLLKLLVEASKARPPQALTYTTISTEMQQRKTRIAAIKKLLK